MFKRVLFATDLSPASELALDCIAEWKALGLTKVTIAHIHNIRYVGGAEGLEEKLRQDHTPKLEKQAKKIKDAGIYASWHLAFGVPYLELEKIAKEENSEVVVIGSHGASWIKEICLGSIANAILRYVQLPVLVIKINLLKNLHLEKCKEFCHSLLDKVLIATDFSPASSGAINFAFELAKSKKSHLHLLHIQEKSRIFPHLAKKLEEFNKEDMERLNDLNEKLIKAGALDVSTEIRTDYAVSGIIESIMEWKPSLVVLGRHGRGKRIKNLIGSTSHDVACESPVPVLVVPEEGVGFKDEE